MDVLKSKLLGAAVSLLVGISPMLIAPDTAEAARSGGRAGGGSSFRSAPRAPTRMAPRPAAPRSAPSSTSRTVITRNNYIGVPSIGFSPFGYSPFGYSPFGGLNTGYALGQIASGGGNSAQAYRLENEVNFGSQINTSPQGIILNVLNPAF